MSSPLPLWVRLNLWYLVISNVFPGVWAAFGPQSFYDFFPDFGLGLRWVASDGPYNEHLIRDVGAFFLSVSILPLLALLRPRLVAVRAVPLCLLLFNGLHLAYHLGHLHMVTPVNRYTSIAALIGSLVLTVTLWLAPTDSTPAAAPGVAS
ncbi:hypothetical protein [Hymenobacter weizhouensis]|uniref:hypothetical protein n=1 Tax=Hymenobacter sp. YIM 151500-1 TaxID=2987689 RepID=UPI002227271C|nr:hypothetical protein [Hymenobacter sp. YIM 151500-1]UYZ61773.1 hypothetical protein OIS53_12250 [Hymenobacter sp. YIM 151500-1]